MSESERNKRRKRHAAIRAEVAQEEAEAAEAEAFEQAGILDVPLHLRITRELDSDLRRRAALEHIPTSALVRKLLTQAINQFSINNWTEQKITEIARRVAREEIYNA
jgi:hypothetical protein